MVSSLHLHHAFFQIFCGSWKDRKASWVAKLARFFSSWVIICHNLSDNKACSLRGNSQLHIFISDVSCCSLEDLWLVTFWYFSLSSDSRERSVREEIGNKLWQKLQSALPCNWIFMNQWIWIYFGVHITQFISCHVLTKLYRNNTDQLDRCTIHSWPWSCQNANSGFFFLYLLILYLSIISQFSFRLIDSLLNQHWWESQAIFTS